MSTKTTAYNLGVGLIVAFGSLTYGFGKTPSLVRLLVTLTWTCKASLQSLPALVSLGFISTSTSRRLDQMPHIRTTFSEP